MTRARLPSAVMTLICAVAVALACTSDDGAPVSIEVAPTETAARRQPTPTLSAAGPPDVLLRPVMIDVVESRPRPTTEEAAAILGRIGTPWETELFARRPTRLRDPATDGEGVVDASAVPLALRVVANR